MMAVGLLSPFPNSLSREENPPPPHQKKQKHTLNLRQLLVETLIYETSLISVTGNRQEKFFQENLIKLDKVSQKGFLELNI